MKNKLKLPALLLSLVIMLTVIPYGVAAESASTVWGGNEVPGLVRGVYDLNEDGTKEDVYEIATAAQLEWFARYVNSGHKKSNAVLVADIDLSGYTHTPIGVNYSDFEGIFDGMGYTVKNMNFTCTENGLYQHLETNYQGLFGVIRSGAVVRNFTLYGTMTVASSNIYYIGGAVGLAYESSVISNVNSYVNITDGGNSQSEINSVGGVVGRAGNNSNNSNTPATVQNCRYYGSISLQKLTESKEIGGIAGSAVCGSNVLNCENRGNVNACDVDYVAGVVGAVQSGSKIKASANYGSVTIVTPKPNISVGGVAGYANENVLIDACVNAGKVSVTAPGRWVVNLGGILGYASGSEFAGLTDCFNYGSITAENGTTNYTGAIVGVVSAGSASKITGNYWRTGSCGQAYGPSSAQPAAPTAASVITSSATKLENSWYIAQGTVTINSRLPVNGKVRIFLADGANLSVKNGIGVNYGNSLEIYAESEPVYNADGSINTSSTSTGKLTATATDEWRAGIGSYELKSGEITINGGIISATGGNNACGIGGSTGPKGKYSSSNITINGGNVTATGVAGIGGWYERSEATITITGGVVKATGTSGAGIGGISESETLVVTIVITGGKITANGGSYSAGIGGGRKSGGGTVTISGGNITASGDSLAGTGIGCGNVGSGGAVTIKGGKVTATGGSQAAGIGGSNVKYTGKVTITGGTVTAATGGEADACGLGCGLPGSGGNTSTVTVHGGTVAAVSTTRSNLTAIGLNSGKNTNWRLSTGSSTSSLSVQNHSGKNPTADKVFKIEPCTEHSDNNGKCRYCNKELGAPKNTADGYYEISTADRLSWFSDYVGGGNGNACGRLMADVDLTGRKSFGIGTYESPFRGTFDGNGFKLTVGLESTAEYVAPFRYILNAVIKNLQVDGTISTSAKYAGGIVARSDGGTLAYCLSYVNITSSVNGDGTHGGLVANSGSGDLVINCCGFAGSIKGSNTYSCGGLVGWAGATVNTIIRSFVAAEFQLNTAHSDDNSNVIVRNPTSANVRDCYYMNALKSSAGDATQISQNGFKSGEVCYLLNGSTSSGTLDWYQTYGVGGDPYPVLDPTHGIISYDGSSYSSTVCLHGDYENGFCKYCGDGFKEPTKDANGVYQIADAGNLYWFADYVNQSSKNASASAKLTENITVNSSVLTNGALNSGSFRQWTPIGKNYDCNYTGTFDGNGKTISGLYYSGNDTYVGLFGNLGDGARLQNISVTDSYFHTSGSTYIGGIAGYARSIVTYKQVSIRKCTFSGAVSASTSSSDSVTTYVGGLVGYASEVALTSCCSSATVSLTNQGFRDYVGGLVGYAQQALNIDRCYNIGAVSATGSSSSTYVGSVIGYLSPNVTHTVTSCYYLTGTAAGGISDGTDNTIAKSADAFASGEVCYLLNGSTSLGTPDWYQTCGEGLPAFSGKTVFKVGENYRNSEKTGDVNGDGEIDILDLVRMKKNFALNANTQEMDVNSDNKSDTNDMVLLRKFIMNVISSFD